MDWTFSIKFYNFIFLLNLINISKAKYSAGILSTANVYFYKTNCKILIFNKA